LKTPTFLPYLWMLCGCLFFSLMGAMAHGAREHCAWQLIAACRAGVAFVLALLLAWYAGARLVWFRPPVLWLRSLSGSISMVCTFYALTRSIPMADVVTLTNTFPLWVAVLSWPLLGEPPPAAIWPALLCGSAGMVLIQQPHFAEGHFEILLALISALFSALAMLGLHRLQGIDARAIVVHFSGVSFLFCLGSFWAFDRSSALLPDGLGGRVVLLLLGVGVTATIGQLFLTMAFAAGEPARVSVVSLSQIVFAMILDNIFWQRTVNALTLVGTVLVMTPTAWVLLLPRPSHARERPEGRDKQEPLECSEGMK
jgi:drug/metabolite transporter (DMT)-like permease